MILTTLALFALLPGLSYQALDTNAVSLEEKVLAVERLMLTPGTIDFQVAPCSFLLNGPPLNSPDFSGEQTSAHWIRTAFHDFVTANVTAGTGGLDASIGFETLRQENEGTIAFDGLNFAARTIIGFNLFSSVFISTADFIALGVAETLLSCDHSSPMMELRVGRIDATSAGPPGVPQPLDSLVSQRAAFARAGMNQTEMIQAVACGHTIGGVHGVTFPGIVGNQPTAGSSETDFFDDTPYLFDNVGLQNYIAGTNKAGGPLVTTANTTARSDLKIFQQDNNATVKAMAATQLAFQNTCIRVFEKMINTVPRGIELSAPIGPRKFITMFGYVDFSGTAIKYFGRVSTYGKTAAPSTAAFVFGTTTASGVAGTGATGNTQPGFSAGTFANPSAPGGELFPFFGAITYYDFNTTISTTTTSLRVQNVYTQPVNTKLFVVPSLTYTQTYQPGSGSKVLVRAALLTTLATSDTQLNATLYYATELPGTTSATYKRVVTSLKFWKRIGDYSIYQGEAIQPAVPEAPGVFNSKRAIDVVKSGGTTLRSDKFEIEGLTGRNGVRECSNSDLKTC